MSPSPSPAASPISPGSKSRCFTFGEVHDVVVTNDEHQWHVSADVLREHSEFFKTALSGAATDLELQRIEVKLPGYSATIHRCLQLMYHGTFDAVNNFTGTPSGPLGLLKDTSKTAHDALANSEGFLGASADSINFTQLQELLQTQVDAALDNFSEVALLATAYFDMTKLRDRALCQFEVLILSAFKSASLSSALKSACHLAVKGHHKTPLQLAGLFVQRHVEELQDQAQFNLLCTNHPELVGKLWLVAAEHDRENYSTASDKRTTALMKTKLENDILSIEVEDLGAEKRRLETSLESERSTNADLRRQITLEKEGHTGNFKILQQKGLEVEELRSKLSEAERERNTILRKVENLSNFNATFCKQREEATKACLHAKCELETRLNLIDGLDTYEFCTDILSTAPQKPEGMGTLTDLEWGLQSLNAVVGRVCQSNDEMQIRAIQRDERNEKLIARLEHEIEEANTMLEDRRFEIHDLTRIIDCKDNELQTRQTLRAASQTTNSRAVLKIEKPDDATLDNQLYHLREVIKDKSIIADMVPDLKTKINELQDQARSRERDIVDLEREVNDNKSRLQDAQGRFDGNIAHLREQIKDMAQQRAGKNDAAADFAKALLKLQEGNEEQAREVQRLKDRAPKMVTRSLAYVRTQGRNCRQCYQTSGGFYWKIDYVDEMTLRCPSCHTRNHWAKI